MRATKPAPKETPMTYRGHVQNGVVVLDEPAKLPDGTSVDVQPVPPPEPTLGEKLLKYAGIVEGPPDLAINHDHYLYGVPKRKS
jgi:hypothetical protein